MHESIDFRILIGLNKHINMPGLQYRRDGNDRKFRSNLSTVVNGKPVSAFSKYKLLVMRTKRKTLIPSSPTADELKEGRKKCYFEYTS